MITAQNNREDDEEDYEGEPEESVILPAFEDLINWIKENIKIKENEIQRNV